MEFLNAFGISWKSLIAQFVNFAILMFLLHRLAYKPLLQFMKDRSERIAKGLQDAQDAQKNLLDSRKEQEKLLTQARKEASVIIESARKAADLQGAAIVTQAKEEVGGIVAQGKKALQQERSLMLQEVKKDVIDMVIASAEKILGGAVDAKMDEKWLSNQLTHVKK